MGNRKDITTTRSPEYTKNQFDWQTIRDCLDGQTAIKAKTVVYLPFPVALDDEDRKTPEFHSQYSIYLGGAVYVNHTSQAVEDLTAGIFKRDPIFEELPEDLEGIDIKTLARKLAVKTTSFGRAFALVDYPRTDGAITRDEENKNNIHAFAVTYDPSDILDWNVIRVGGKNVLQRVVLSETVVDKETNKEVKRYRELELKPPKDNPEASPVYTITMYDDAGEMVGDEIIPQAMGKPLDHITGTFVGVTSNSAEVDKSPILGIAQTNVKHYQTWAELNHVQTYVGHPTLAITNAPTGFLKAAKENKIRIGIGASNAIVIEGESGDAKIIEINGQNIIHFKTLEKLEESMTDQGARLRSSQQKNGVESGEALMIRNSGDNSVMASIATQVENAVEICVQYASEYMGVTILDDWAVNLNKSFIDETFDANIARELSALVTAGLIPARILHDYLKRVGMLGVEEDSADLIQEVKDSNPTNADFSNPTLTNETTTNNEE